MNSFIILLVILSSGLCNGIEVVRRNSNGGLAARGSSISDNSRASVAPILDLLDLKEIQLKFKEIERYF